MILAPRSPSSLRLIPSSQLLNTACQNASATRMSESSDGNDRSRFNGKRLGFVGDQAAQERNQRDQRNTNREAAGAKLREQLRVPGVGGDRRGARRLGDHARKVARKERRE